MDALDWLKDALKDEIVLQTFYNTQLMQVTNPTARQIFTQMRDDQFRHITELQVNIERLEARPGVVQKMIQTLVGGP